MNLHHRKIGWCIKNGQAEAIRLGIARAFLVLNGEYKKELRDSGYLTRDPRKVERKKPEELLSGKRDNNQKFLNFIKKS